MSDAAVQIQSNPATASTSSTDQPVAADPNRPAWLPEKFKTAEDFAKSYTELEKKLGGSKTEETKTPAEPTKAQSTEIGKYVEEFTKNGKLSDESYKALADAGISKEMVDAYQKGTSSFDTSKLVAEIGGEEKFNAIKEWAGQNLTQAEADEYNALLSEGPTAAKRALKELKSRYEDANGVEPSVRLGGKAGETVQKFRSNAEWQAAIDDPRYQTDEAYRKDVARRVP